MDLKNRTIEKWSNLLKIWNVLNIIENYYDIPLTGKVAKVPSACEFGGFSHLPPLLAYIGDYRIIRLLNKIRNES